MTLVSFVGVTLFNVPLSEAGATPRQMSTFQVAQFALRCAGKNSVTTYFDIKCSAVHSTNVTLVSGVVGGPTEYPQYSAIGFLFNRLTNAYTCYAYPDKVGAQPINVTENCPLWLVSKEYDKTNFPSVYALATSFASAPPPTLGQLQSAATSAKGMPSVTAGDGVIYSSAAPKPAATYRMKYGSGIGRNWCLWFFPSTDPAGDPGSTSLFGPPGMYGVC